MTPFQPLFFSRRHAEGHGLISGVSVRPRGIPAPCGHAWSGRFDFATFVGTPNRRPFAFAAQTRPPRTNTGILYTVDARPLHP